MDNGCCIDFVQALEEGYFEWTPEYEAYTVLMGEQGIVIMHGVKYCPFCGTLLERPDNET